MTDYMKEAERLMRQYTTAVLEQNYEATAFYHSALLAHIQRGAVPDMYDRIAEAHDASLDEDHTGCRAILKECMRLLGLAPDQFRDAAKMMAAQKPLPSDVAAILADNMHLMYESGAPAPAEVPMPEPAAHTVWAGVMEKEPCGSIFLSRKTAEEYATQIKSATEIRSLVYQCDARTYGDAREAAGYARGMKEAGLDVDVFHDLTVALRALLDMPDNENTKRHARLLLQRAETAPRGEVK